MTETWVTESKSELLYVDGYKLATSFKRSEHTGGGVCIFVKDNIDYRELDSINKKSIEFIFETCAIEILKLDLIIIVIYWPDDTRMPDLFYESLEKLLKFTQVKYTKKRIMIGGDFNVDMLIHNPPSIKLLELFKSFFFFNT